MTAPQLAPGSVVAQKYRIGALLGYGGSSATYQAQAGDGREVVLKIFDPAMRQRADIMSAIEQTYAATNALPQDVAVPLLDAGYDATSGAPFSVGERIPVPSLAQLVAQRPLGADDVARILGVLAALLEQAHGRGLFHHALKPTNVFVGFAQGQGVRVTDFGAGLARAAVPTQEGYAIAAPWLAPEQVQATSPAAAAADVFAVGLLVFHALTGRSYWQSCQGQAPDLGRWQQELLGPRTPPSVRAAQIGAMLNAAFDGVLGCALSIDPGQRYRSVQELAQAFEGLVGQRAPESQATMAFPTSSLGVGGPGAGGYPPLPAAGGYPAPAQPYAAQPLPYGAQATPGAAPNAWGQQQPGQPSGNPAYVSTQTPPAPVQPPGYEGGPAHAPVDERLRETTTAAARILDPAVAAPRKQASMLAPILVGAVAVLLLGGAAAAWVIMGKRPPPAATQATSATASPTPAPDSAAPSAAPADSASAAPADSASAAPSAEADAGPTAVSSTLACDPECDEIKVDDKPIELGKPVDLVPGKHTVVASKSGYTTVHETLVVNAGDKIEKTFKLKEKAVATSAPAPAPTKPCGKFLKRGAGCK